MPGFHSFITIIKVVSWRSLYLHKLWVSDIVVIQYGVTCRTQRGLETFNIRTHLFQSTHNYFNGTNNNNNNNKLQLYVFLRRYKTWSFTTMWDLRFSRRRVSRCLLAASSSETSVNICQTTWCYIPENIHLIHGRCLTAEHWGECLDLRGMKWHETGENSIIRSFIICTLQQILLG
jgi:hypothetical protein